MCALYIVIQGRLSKSLLSCGGDSVALILRLSPLVVYILEEESGSANPCLVTVAAAQQILAELVKGNWSIAAQQILAELVERSLTSHWRATRARLRAGPLLSQVVVC